MIPPKFIYVAMMEVKRLHCEPGAINTADRIDYQRQRRSGHDWLNWYSDASRYYSQLPEPTQQAMELIYWQRSAVPEKAAWVVILADEGLEKWYNSLPGDVISQGERIAREL